MLRQSISVPRSPYCLLGLVWSLRPTRSTELCYRSVNLHNDEVGVIGGFIHELTGSNPSPIIAVQKRLGARIETSRGCDLSNNKGIYHVDAPNRVRSLRHRVALAVRLR
jgi:hypothetical protein